MTPVEKAAALVLSTMLDKEAARRAYNVTNDRRLAYMQMGKKDLAAAEQICFECNDRWLQARNTYLNLMIKKGRGV